MPRQEWVSLAQLLTELGDEEGPLAESTFYDWIAKGRFPRGLKLPNGKRRWRRTTVDSWFNELEKAQ